MSMNAGIILGAQSPDIIGAMDRGRALAEGQINLTRQNALAELYRTQGAGIAAGDQEALNALAGFDPNAALGVKQNLLGMKAQEQEMAFSAEKMQMLRDESRREAEAGLAAQAEKLTKEQLAKEHEALSSALSGAAFYYQNKDQAGYTAFLQSKGIDPAEFPFESFPAHAATVEGVLDAMKAFAPPEAPKPQTEAAKLKADLDAGLIDQASYEAELARRAPKGTKLTVDPATGAVTFEDGVGVGQGGGKPLTEGQAKLTVFQTDMVQAAEVLTDLEKRYDPTNMQDAAAGMLGDKWGSFLQTDDGQIYKSAALQWLDSGIRIRTGAAATEGEVARQFSSMFPQPGDTPATVKYKRRARENFQRSVDAALKGVQDPMAPEAPEDMYVPSDASGAPAGKSTGNKTSSGISWSIEP